MLKKVKIQSLIIHDTENSNGYFITGQVEGLGVPKIRVAEIYQANVDGVYVSQHLYGERLISFSGVIYGNTAEEHVNRRSQFASIARVYRENDNAVPLLFSFTTIDNKELQVSCFVKNLEMTSEYVFHTKYKIDLLCSDFRIVSQEEKNVVVPIFSGGGFGVPVNIPLSLAVGGSATTTIVNAGNTMAIPRFRIYGQIDDPVLYNVTTGKNFTIDYTVASGTSYIDVDVSKRTVLYYSSQTANPINIRDKFSGDWWEIESGTNTIKLVTANSGHSGFVVLYWRDSYIGI